MPVETIYEVQPDDFLSTIAAAFHISLAELEAANPQIINFDSIQIGQLIKIPTREPGPVAPTPTIRGTTYDGIHPAPGTISMRRAFPISPPLTNAPGERSAEVLAQLINQFAVGHNPRYLHDGGGTYCNIFVWDVTRALGAEVPHWLNPAGDTAAAGSGGASEVNINGGIDWMRRFGVTRHGWRLSSAAEAQQFANEGKVAVVVWRNPIGHGHTAIVRPGEITSRGPATAQAGSVNFNMGHMTDGFNVHPGTYFVHD